MPAYFIDSTLIGDAYSTTEMRQIFSDESWVQRCLDVEAALAQTEAALGVIPAEAAEEITKKARAENIDLDELRKEILDVGHRIVPLVRLLQKACAGDAGQYIHWGATTQDIIDTATVLQLRDSLAVFDRELAGLEAAAIRQAREHRTTLMAGRTHGQQALPITFGYKVAVWASEIRRHRQRIREIAPRVLVGQLSGAVGTMASFGDHGPAILAGTMERLGLGVPDISWQAARDRFAEVVCLNGLIAATLGKIAGEIIELMKTEFMEVEERFQMGKVGSSTMPHKRNPLLSEGIKALTFKIRGNATVALMAASPEHERDRAAWDAELTTLYESCLLLGAALQKTRLALEGLVVHADSMAANLNKLGGLLLSEAVMLDLAQQIGRQDAHEVVYETSMKAFEERRSLKEALLGDDRIAGRIPADHLDRLLDPANYVGRAPQLVDEITERLEKEPLSELSDLR